ncbi:RNA methyltransferase substrate-binding domain-containing protein, partial [Peptoniphilus sp. oral taxon 386]
MKEYVYGRNPVIEILKNKKADKLYVQMGNFEGSMKKIYAMAKEQNILITELNKKKLDELSEGANHQGVVALVSGYEYSTLEDLILNGINQILILDK